MWGYERSCLHWQLSQRSHVGPPNVLFQTASLHPSPSFSSQKHTMCWRWRNLLVGGFIWGRGGQLRRGGFWPKPADVWLVQMLEFTCSTSPSTNIFLGLRPSTLILFFRFFKILLSFHFYGKCVSEVPKSLFWMDLMQPVVLYWSHFNHWPSYPDENLKLRWVSVSSGDILTLKPSFLRNIQPEGFLTFL